jgi:hypothetical protein
MHNNGNGWQALVQISEQVYDAKKTKQDFRKVWRRRTDSTAFKEVSKADKSIEGGAGKTTTKIERKSMSPAIQELTDAVTNATTVEASAMAFINGVPGLVTDAVTKALDNGATKEQLAPLSDLSKQLEAQSQALKDALTANTPQGEPSTTPQARRR